MKQPPEEKSSNIVFQLRIVKCLIAPISGDEDRTHNKLRILDAGRPREISEMSKVIETLDIKHQFTRYYFAESSDRDAAVEEGR